MRWLFLVLVLCACGDSGEADELEGGQLEDSGKLEGGRVSVGHKPGKVPNRTPAEDAGGELEGGAIDGGRREDAGGELEAFTGTWEVNRTTTGHDCPSSVPVMDYTASTWTIAEGLRGSLSVNVHQATVPGDLQGMRAGATWSASTSDGAQLVITLAGAYAGATFTASETSTLRAGAIVCTIHRDVTGRRK